MVSLSNMWVPQRDIAEEPRNEENAVRLLRAKASGGFRGRADSAFAEADTPFAREQTRPGSRTTPRTQVRRPGKLRRSAAWSL